MNSNLSVTQSSVDYLREALAVVRKINADGNSQYAAGDADGIEYALKVLGLWEEKP